MEPQTLPQDPYIYHSKAWLTLCSKAKKKFMVYENRRANSENKVVQFIFDM